MKKFKPGDIIRFVKNGDIHIYLSEFKRIYSSNPYDYGINTYNITRQDYWTSFSGEDYWTSFGEENFDLLIPVED